MKLIDKDFDFETFDKFAISKLICEVEHDNTNYQITISDNNCDARFGVCEYENDDVDDDIIEIFENSDFYDDLIDYANEEKSEAIEKLQTDFENEFDSKYELMYKDNIYLNDYQQQIFKNGDDDYILKLKNIHDNSLSEYYDIRECDFEISDDDTDNIIIHIDYFDYDLNKISIFDYSI